MTKLEDLNLEDFTNPERMLKENLSLLSEIVPHMNEEERTRLSFFDAQAIELKKQQENLKMQFQIFSEQIKKSDEELQALFYQAIERMKLEKYKN